MTICGGEGTGVRSEDDKSGTSTSIYEVVYYTYILSYKLDIV